MNVTSHCTLAAQSMPEAAAWLVDLGGKPDAAAHAAAATASTGSSPPPPALHRLGEVRRREGLTRRKLARRLGVSVAEVQAQERPSSDLLLSDLYRWQKALEVPTAELLHEPGGELSPPVQWRTRLLRAMKTVRSLQAGARQVSIRRLAAMLADQLVEIMPELKDTTAWPALGARRSDTIEPSDWHLVYQRRWS